MSTASLPITAPGTSELIYAPDGLRCILTGELTELQTADDLDAA